MNSANETNTRSIKSLTDQEVEDYMSMYKLDVTSFRGLPPRFSTVARALMFLQGFYGSAIEPTKTTAEPDGGTTTSGNPEYLEAPFELEVRIIKSRDFPCSQKSSVSPEVLEEMHNSGSPFLKRHFKSE